MRTKYKAGLVLLLSIAGFIISYPYAGNGFWSGLINSGFLAATIGGLADWFAVTAIFRKPLGIPYRTEILVRNRQRIMEAIVEFASQDLLSVDNIAALLKKLDLAKMMVEYLKLRDGREKMMAVFDDVLSAFWQEATQENMAARSGKTLKEVLLSTPLPADLLPKVLRAAGRTPCCELFLCVGTNVFLQFWQTEFVQQNLLSRIASIRDKYLAGSASRAMAFEMMGMSAEKILAALNQKIFVVQQEINQEDSHKHQQAIAWLSAKAEQLADHDDGLSRWLASCWQEMLADCDVQSALADVMQDEEIQAACQQGLHKLFSQQVDRFLEDGSWQRKYDEFVKDKLAEEMEKYHFLIPAIINDRLAEFTDDKLVDFVETRIADDLQMIRINGSVVGAAAGMGLFAILFCLERIFV